MLVSRVALLLLVQATLLLSGTRLDVRQLAVGRLLGDQHHVCQDQPLHSAGGVLVAGAPPPYTSCRSGPALLPHHRGQLHPLPPLPHSRQGCQGGIQVPEAVVDGVCVPKAGCDRVSGVSKDG